MEENNHPLTWGNCGTPFSANTIFRWKISNKMEKWPCLLKTFIVEEGAEKNPLFWKWTEKFSKKLFLFSKSTYFFQIIRLFSLLSFSGNLCVCGVSAAPHFSYHRRRPTIAKKHLATPHWGLLFFPAQTSEGGKRCVCVSPSQKSKATPWELGGRFPLPYLDCPSHSFSKHSLPLLG